MLSKEQLHVLSDMKDIVDRLNIARAPSDEDEAYAYLRDFYMKCYLVKKNLYALQSASTSRGLLS